MSGVCQNFFPCLKLNRPWMVIVYCYIDSGHNEQRSRGVPKHFCMSKTQQTTMGHCLLLYSFKAKLAHDWGERKHFCMFKTQ